MGLIQTIGRGFVCQFTSVTSPKVIPLEPCELPLHLSKLLSSCDSDMSDRHMRRVHDLLFSVSDTFMDPHVNLSATDAVVHYINTADTHPISIPPHRIAPDKKKIIKEEVAKM